MSSLSSFLNNLCCKYPGTILLFMSYIVIFVHVRHDFCLTIRDVFPLVKIWFSKMEARYRSALNYHFPSIIIFCFHFVRSQKGLYRPLSLFTVCPRAIVVPTKYSLLHNATACSEPLISVSN